MTCDPTVLPTPENEPRERAGLDPATPATHSSAYPVRVDETSLFSRTDLQKTLLLELPADVRSRLMEPPATQPAAPVLDDAAAYRGHTLRMDRRDLDRALEQAQQSPAVALARDTPAALDPMATVYDGGALREHALKLSEALAGAATAVTAPGQDQRDAPSNPTAVQAPRRRYGLDAVAGAWRKASLARRAILVLFPLAALATLWPDDAAEARSSAPAARAPAVKPQPALSPANSAAPSPVVAAPSSPTEATPLVEATPAQRFVEAQALKAAFSGDGAAAARHYEVLARELRDPRFELALRLVRADAVRRP